MTTPDERKRALLDLIPAGRVFRHCYSDDSLWRPESAGYVNERDPLRAGLYEPGDHYGPWAPPSVVECPACGGAGECDGDYENESPPCGTCEGMCYVPNPGGRTSEHSFTVDAAETIAAYASNVQDGTVLALLIDELIHERRRADDVTRQAYLALAQARVLGEGGAS